MPRRKTTAGPIDPMGDFDPDDDMGIDDGLPERAELIHRKESRNGDQAKETAASKRGKPTKASRSRRTNQGDELV
jgi:hypothetical protein